MNDRMQQPDTAARAEAMRKARDPEGKAPGWNVAEKLHSMLPEWLSARAAVLKKRRQLEDMDRMTEERPQ